REIDEVMANDIAANASVQAPTRGIQVGAGNFCVDLLRREPVSVWIGHGSALLRFPSGVSVPGHPAVGALVRSAGDQAAIASRRSSSLAPVRDSRSCALRKRW